MAGCDQGKPKEIDVKLHNASGDEVGTAKVTQQTSGVKLRLKGKVSRRPHGLHVHEIESVKHLVLNQLEIILIQMIKTWTTQSEGCRKW